MRVGDTPQERDRRTLEEVFYPAERVPFVAWREFSGAKPTVVLTGILALLSFVTGLSNLSAGTVPLNGPLAGVLPMGPRVAQFAGVLFAFVLGLVAVGLQRRKRLAWRAAIIVVPALALLPLTTFAMNDIPLLLGALLTTPLLIRNRDRFDQAFDLSPLQAASLSAVFGVGLYGAVGSYALRSEFVGLTTWGDAVYFVIVTVATVGYGDITPTSAVAKWFSLSVILLGTGAFTVAVGALIGPAIESRMAAAFGNMTASELTLLEDHVVVLGYGDITASLLEELDDETELVVVTQDADVASSLTDQGVNVLTKDPTDEATLEDASIGSARGVVVGSGDDARDVLSVLAARNVAPDVRIVAAASEEKHVDKLESVGADEVVNPRRIGGRLLGRSVLDGVEPSFDTLVDEDGGE